MQFKIQNYRKIKKELPGIEENIALKNYTTFKIGGPARYFFIAQTKEDIIKAVGAAKKINLPFFILGGGSNVLVSDKGYKGLVIKIQNSKTRVERSEAKREEGDLSSSPLLKIQNYKLKFKIFCDAGISLSQLVNKSAKINVAGLEWASGIPGTIGGAVRGNAGAFGKEIKDIVKEVTVFDVGENKIKTLNNKDCKFGYRDSIFKRNSNLIILSAVFQFKKGDQEDIQQKIKEYLDCRRKNHPLSFSSAGSIFKNSKIKIQNKKLLEEFPEIEGFNKNDLISVSYLIEKCGLKGKKIGNVKISAHCNFIVNLGNGKAKEVIKLMKLIKQKVKKKFKIDLEEEIIILTYPH